MSARTAKSAIFSIVAATMVSSCIIDDAYNFDNIKGTDLTVTVFQEGIEFPIGTTDSLTLKKLTSLSGGDLEILSVAEDGSYYYGVGDEFMLSEEIEMLDMSEYSEIDAMSFEFTTNAELLVDYGFNNNGGEQHIVMDGDFVAFEQSMDFTLLSGKDLPESMEYISRLDLTNVYINCVVNIDGLPQTVSGNFYIDAEAILPECLSPSTVSIQGILDNGRYVAEPIKVNSINDIDFSKGEDIVGTMTLKGRIYVQETKVVSNSIADNVTASVRATVCNDDGVIAISRMSGRCSYDFEYDMKIEVADMSDIFNGEGTCLDIVNARLAIDVASNMGVPMTGNLELIPWRGGEAGEPEIKLDNVKLPYTYLPQDSNEIHLCLGDSELGCPDGYEFIEAPISDIFKNLPDSIQVRITGCVDAESESVVYTDAKYDFNIAYNFIMPLEAGEEFEMSVADTLELSQQIVDVLKMGSICLKIKTANTFALGMNLSLDILDEDGNILDIKESPMIASIAAGNGSDVPAITETEIVIKPVEGAAIDEIYGILITFTLVSGEEIAALSESCYIKAEIAAYLPEGITVTIGGNKDNGTAEEKVNEDLRDE